MKKKSKLIVEDFTFEEFKEYLESVAKFAENKETLLKLGNGLHGENTCKWHQETKKFKIYTNLNK